MQRLYHILFFFLIALTLAIIAAFIYMPIVEGKIKTQLTQMLESEFPDASFSIQGMGVHLVTGDFIINKFQLKDSSQHIGNVSLNGLLINNVSWSKLLRKRRLNAQEIRVENVDLIINSADSKFFQSEYIDSLKQRFDFHDLNIKKLNFEVNDTINDVAIKIKDAATRLSFKNMNPDIIDGFITIDSTYFKGKKGYYAYNSGSIKLDVAENSLKMENIKMEPQYPIGSFSRRQGKRVLRQFLQIPQAELFGFDFREFMLKGNFLVQRMELQDLVYRAFENPIMPIDSSARKLLPQERLLLIDRNIIIDTIQVKSGYYRYTTVNQEREEPGYITFDNTFISLYNVTNDSIAIGENAVMKMDFLCNFMNAARLTGSAAFNLKDKKYPYSIRCYLGEMDIAVANTVGIPVMNLNLVGGRNIGLDLNITADKSRFSGSADFSYDGLQVNTKKRNGSSGELMIQWLVNNVLIKKKNIKGEMEYRAGEIAYERKGYLSFMKNFWKATETGLANSILGQKNVKYLDRLLHSDDEDLYIDMKELEEDMLKEQQELLFEADSIIINQ